jgi:hypothetical protein
MGDMTGLGDGLTAVGLPYLFRKKAKNRYLINGLRGLRGRIHGLSLGAAVI